MQWTSKKYKCYKITKWIFAFIIIIGIISLFMMIFLCNRCNIKSDKFMVFSGITYVSFFIYLIMDLFEYWIQDWVTKHKLGREDIFKPHEYWFFHIDFVVSERLPKLSLFEQDYVTEKLYEMSIIHYYSLKMFSESMDKRWKKDRDPIKEKIIGILGQIQDSLERENDIVIHIDKLYQIFVEMLDTTYNKYNAEIAYMFQNIERHTERVREQSLENLKNVNDMSEENKQPEELGPPINDNNTVTISIESDY